MGLRAIRLAAKRLLRDYDGVGTDRYRIASVHRERNHPGSWCVCGEPRGRYREDGPPPVAVGVDPPKHRAYVFESTWDPEDLPIRRPAWEHRARRR